ncbi:MAG: 30S ribosomal protein S6 [Chitinivibrionales bacterium]|nr:30S ribosomal protein S6 [Chitinivibrionales bacterium]
MKRHYETAVVFDGTLSSEAVSQEQKKVEDLIRQQGNFEKTDAWGNRRLAYEINRKKSGYYCLFYFDSDRSISGHLDRAFKLNPAILRHLTLVRDPEKKIYQERKGHSGAGERRVKSEVREEA